MKTALHQLNTGYVELFLVIYLIARWIASLVRDKTTDRLNELAILTLVLSQPRTVTQLAELLSIKPSAMSEKISQLMDKGWLRQQPGQDARTKCVVLTPSGQRYWQQTLSKVGQDFCQTAQPSLTEQEITTTLTVLQKLAPHTIKGFVL